MPRALSLYLPRWSIDLINRRERARASTPAPGDSADRAAVARPYRAPGSAAPPPSLSPTPAPPSSLRPSVPPSLFPTPTSPPSLRRSVPPSLPPIILSSIVSQRQVVAHCCPAAYHAGIRPGMTVAEARALLPPGRLRLQEHDPERDLAALRALAQWALRFSPLVALDPPDGLLLDVSGCARLFRGEHRLVDRLSRSLERLGLLARVAVAPTYACAGAVARFGPSDRTVIPEAGVRTALQPLPVAALRVPPQVVVALDELGVTTIAQLLRLPRSALPSRFGAELLLRIDQAMGSAVEIIQPVAPIIPLRLERLFDGPTTQLEAVELATHELLEELADELRRQERGVIRLAVLLERIGSEPVSFTLTLGRPSRNAPHLWAMVRPRLEKANLGFGVERIEITAVRTARLRHQQTSCWTPTGTQPDADTDAAFWEFADTVISRLGLAAVLRAEVRSTHLPERLIRWRSVLQNGERPARAPGQWGGSEEDPPVADRPSLLFDPPEPADVVALTPDGPLLRLTWRAESVNVVHCTGPERLAPEWWRLGVHDTESPPASTSTRDYFKLQTDSARWLWVFRELDRTPPRWFIHGEWT